VFRSTPEDTMTINKFAAQTITREASLAALVDLYRHHAAAQRRMVSRRNRVVVRSRHTVDPKWTERSLDVFMSHDSMMDAVRDRLRELGMQHLALQLQHEDTAYRRRAWRRISGERDERVTAKIDATLRRTRRVIAAIRAGMPSWKCASQTGHVAHVWTGPADHQWLCQGTAH
jgi:hypothetical protein